MPERIEVEFIGKDKLSGVARSAGSALDRFGASALKIGGTAIVGGLAAAGTAIAGLSVAALDLAKQAAPVENIRAAFDGLVGSVGKGGAEMLKALQKASGGMIASRDLMISFNQAAGLVGIQLATKLPDAMGAMQKVSAATGRSMTFLLESLVTGVGRLSTQWIDNLNVTVTVEEATARASAQLGIAAGELSKAQVQAAFYEITLEKLNANTAAMPDITDSAAAAMARWTATTQDLKDEIGLAFVPILNELATEALPILKEEIAPLIREMLPGIIELVGGSIKVFMRFAADLVGTVKSSIELINGLMHELGWETNVTSVWLIGLEKILYTIITAIQAATIVVGGFMVLFEVWRQFAMRLAEAIDRAVGKVREFLQFWRDLRAAVKGRLGIEVAGFQQGGSFIVPPGFPNDSFLMGVTSGERVSVEPVAPVTNNFNMTVNSMAATSSVVQDFNMMRAIVG